MSIIRESVQIGEMTVTLETGRLALGGDPATLWSDERIRDAYLGGPHPKAQT